MIELSNPWMQLGTRNIWQLLVEVFLECYRCHNTCKWICPPQLRQVERHRSWCYGQACLSFLLLPQLGGSRWDWSLWSGRWRQSWYCSCLSMPFYLKGMLRNISKFYGQLSSTKISWNILLERELIRSPSIDGKWKLGTCITLSLDKTLTRNSLNYYCKWCRHFSFPKAPVLPAIGRRLRKYSKIAAYRLKCLLPTASQPQHNRRRHPVF